MEKKSRSNGWDVESNDWRVMNGEEKNWIKDVAHENGAELRMERFAHGLSLPNGP